MSIRSKCFILLILYIFSQKNQGGIEKAGKSNMDITGRGVQKKKKKERPEKKRWVEKRKEGKKEKRAKKR